jgi:SAM-dependent methyltransferase
VHHFDPARFDRAISRFGTMFFSDPTAAFANIAAALRPDARLVLLVWQRREHNEWARAIDAALGEAAQPPPPGADPFSLGDADATASILKAAGFDDTDSKTSTSRLSTDATSIPRSRGCAGFKTQARPSRT